MQIRILFITSHYFYQNTLDALNRLDLDIRFQVIAYDNFTQIPQIYRENAAPFDACFVSGISARRTIELAFPNISKPLVAYQVDSDALHRDILRLAVENGSLDFSRTAIDFLLPFDRGYAVTDFLAIDDIRTVYAMTMDWMVKFGQDNPGYAETLILERIDALWNEGKIDRVICMYSSNIPRLQELGIPFRCPFLSDVHLRRLIKDVLVKIELQKLHDNHPSVIQIFPQRTSSLSESELKELSSIIRQYLKKNLIDCVVQETESCLTLITSMQVLRYLTSDFRVCTISSELSRTLAFPVGVAYGIGTTISHAMNNVQIASREAKILGKPFVMDSNGNLIGPLNSGSSMVISQSSRLKFGDVAKSCGLSSMTIQKILALLYNRGSDKITTQELAEGLNTTIRNASRIMKNLQAGGVAEPVYTQPSHSRGRPVQVYMLSFGLTQA